MVGKFQARDWRELAPSPLSLNRHQRCRARRRPRTGRRHQVHYRQNGRQLQLQLPQKPAGQINCEPRVWKTLRDPRLLRTVHNPNSGSAIQHDRQRSANFYNVLLKGKFTSPRSCRIVTPWTPTCRCAAAANAICQFRLQNGMARENNFHGTYVAARFIALGEWQAAFTPPSRRRVRWRTMNLVSYLTLGIAR